MSRLLIRKPAVAWAVLAGDGDAPCRGAALRASHQHIQRTDRRCGRCRPAGVTVSVVNENTGVVRTAVSNG